MNGIVGIREKQCFWSAISLCTMHVCSAYCKCFLLFSQDDPVKTKGRYWCWWMCTWCTNVEVGTVCSWACVWLQGLRLQRGGSLPYFDRPQSKLYIHWEGFMRIMLHQTAQQVAVQCLAAPVAVSSKEHLRWSPSREFKERVEQLLRITS